MLKFIALNSKNTVKRNCY